MIGKLPDPMRRKIESVCGRDASALDLRLAGSWALQSRQKGIRDAEIIKELEEAPWKKKVWWRKERIEIALLQVASLANQKRRYFGWETVMYLSGANISVFLLICAEIWDVSTKMGLDPLKDCPLLPTVQADGVFVASEKWRNRDKNERVGGSQRYQVLSILGALIHKVLIRDLAISNPGHSGFSLRETELTGDKRRGGRIHSQCCQLGHIGGTHHTSKLKGDVTRRKWYLHPLLSPVFAIPYKRVKEPLYVKIDDVRAWIFGTGVPRFGRKDLALLSGKDTFPQQLEFPLGGPR